MSSAAATGCPRPCCSRRLPSSTPQASKRSDLDRPMLLLALDAVARHGLSAYDAAYLALAEAADAELLTADAALAAAAGSRAHLVGPGRIGESGASYGVTSWADWPGAADYLADLRARLTAPA